MQRLIPILFLFFSQAITSSCMTTYIKSVGGDTSQIFDRIYLADFNTAWQAALESLKNTRLDVSNREGGFIQTKWIENTAEKNFIDTFGEASAFLKAQYRFRISLGKGNFHKKPTVKVSVIKEQLIERDVLEGWKGVETDSIDENTLLYRIGRIIYIKTKINQLEEERAKKELEDTQF